MTWQDAVNGSFEFLGAPFIMLSVLKLWREKVVRGVSWVHASFFTVWGFWNLYYYPHLDQWFSFAGGVAIVLANSLWVGLLLLYHRGVPAQPQHAKVVSSTPDGPRGPRPAGG